MPERSHTSTEQWQSFEVRMRRRRAERCIIKAEVALEAGLLDDAVAAIEEARRLDAGAPGLAEISERILLASVPTVVEPEGELAAPSRSNRWLLAAGALAAVSIFAVVAWQALGTADPPAIVSDPAPAPLSVPADASVRKAPAVGIRHMDIVASVTIFEPAPRTLVAEASEPASPVGPEPTLMRAAETGSSETIAAPDVPVVPLAIPESLPSSPPPVVPALRMTETPATVNAASETAPSPPAPAPPPVDERARVRSVLSRYEAAYSGLDASAAHAVWPSVNQRALAEAFDALRSQSLSLGRCDVEVTGSIARAECAGSASFTPKIGSGRTEQRRWAFDLRNASEGWQIVRAQVR